MFFFVIVDLLATNSLCLCVQSEHHLRLPAQTEAYRLVFSHSDPGAGEAGESWPQVPSPYYSQRERCGCHLRPENPL